MDSPRLTLLAGLLALALPAQALAGGPPPGWQKKLDRAMQQAVATKGTSLHRVIVRTAAGQEATIKGLVRGKGRLKAEHRSIRALTMLASGADLQALASNPGVLSVSTDAIVRGAQIAASGTTSAGQSSLAVFGGTTLPIFSIAPPIGFAPASTLRGTLGLDVLSPSGTGVGVAVIDSGIAPSAEFDNRITAFFDFTRGGIATAPYDDYGHGTHVAGLVAGNGTLSGGQYQGVAPAARLIGLKVLDSQGAGYTSDIIAALDFAVAHKADLGIDVINMSLGHPIFESIATDPLVLAVDDAVAHGIVVVVSAGNIGVNKSTGRVGFAGITSPGNAMSAITVGSANSQDTVTRSDDTIADYSSRGPTWMDGFAKPDLVAPGHRMVSATTPQCTLYQLYPQIRVTTSTGSQMLKLSGTSMAAGVVSGAVAVLLDSHRQARASALTARQVKAILEFSAIPIPGAHALAQGTGELNVAGAMELDAALDFTAAGSPLQYPLANSSIIGTDALPWSQRIIWAKNSVLGDAVVWGATAIWAQGDVGNIIWGEADVDNIIWGEADVENIIWGEANVENIIWGEADLDNIVWGEADLDNIIWGENILWGESLLDNVIWGESVHSEGDLDNIIWGEAYLSLDGGSL